MDIHVDNIIDNINYVYNLCDDYYIKAGKDWYKQANQFCKFLHKQYPRYNIQQIVGVLSALSPAVEWETNKYDTIQLLKNKDSIVSTYNKQRDKAISILNLRNPTNNKIINILHGNKTISFYNNILLRNTHITIDRHMGRLLLDNNDLNIVNRLIQNHYVLFSNILLDYSKQHNLKGYELQAILWLKWKSISFVPKNQLSLNS